MNECAHLISDPFEEPLDNLFSGPRRINSDVCVGVRRASPEVELFQLGKVGGKRTPSIAWDSFDDTVQRNIQPRNSTIREHERAIVRLDERAASRGNDDVSFRQKLTKDVPFDGPKVHLAFLRENRGNRAAFARLDTLVDIFGAPTYPATERSGDGGLAGTHEPDQVELIGLHARSDSSTEKNSG